MVFNNIINTGITANDGQGDGIRTNLRKLHDNTVLLKAAVDGFSPDGIKSYQTLTDLNAVNPLPEEGTGAKVVNDPIASKNGFYALSSGIWIKDSALHSDQVIRTETSRGVSGKAVYDHVTDRLGPLFQSQSNLVGATTTHSTFNNEGSTFSGWGSGISTQSAFDTVKLKLNAYNPSFTPTEIRVRIRENNYTGAILQDKKVAWNVINGKQIIVFDGLVSSPLPLWIEFLTDARVGWNGTNGNGDLAQNSPMRYITSANPDQSTVNILFSGSPLNIIYAELFNSTLGENLELTENGIDKIKKSIGENVFVPRIILPDTVYATIGYVRQFFFEGMIEAIDIKQYNIKITGNLNGKQYPNYYEFSPNSSGAFDLIVSLYDNHDHLVATKSCKVIVESTSSSASTNRNILSVGDSLLAGGTMVTELKRMLVGSGGVPSALGPSHVSFIGTVDKGNGVKYEGYGGKTWGFYTKETDIATADVRFDTSAAHGKTNEDLVSVWQDGNGDQWRLETIVNGARVFMSRIGHSNNPTATGTLTHVSGAVHTNSMNWTAWSGGSTNPFWNTTTNALDFQNYMSTNGFAGDIDYVVSQLTWNGMSGNRSEITNHDALLTDVRIFLDQLKNDYPNVKFVLNGIPLPSKNGGLANNYGDATSGYGNYQDLKRSVNGLNLAYQSLANEALYSSWSHL